MRPIFTLKSWKSAYQESPLNDNCWGQSRAGQGWDDLCSIEGAVKCASQLLFYRDTEIPCPLTKFVWRFCFWKFASGNLTRNMCTRNAVFSTSLPVVHWSFDSSVTHSISFEWFIFILCYLQLKTGLIFVGEKKSYEKIS